MRLIAVVAENTIKEIIRDRILYGLIVFALLLVFLSLLLGELSFAEQSRIITDMGLVAIEIGCGFLAIFVGSSLVYREMERQSILTLLSKPVSRTSFLVGKYIGLGLVLVLMNLLLSAVLVFVCRYFGLVNWVQFILAQTGVLLESLFLLSVTIFFGVFCRPVLTTIFSLCVWLIGHGVNDLYYFSQKSQNSPFHDIGLAMAQIIPNLDKFNFREAVIYGDYIPGADIRRAVFLWFGWFIFLLISSAWIFEKRDFT